MPRPVDNPPSPWSSTHVEYLGEPPPAKLEIFEEEARSIITENDSPDVGFRYSVNPYRGCLHACAYCLVGETPVLMADGTTRAIQDLRVGDAIIGTELRGRYRYFVRTDVRAHWRTVKPAYRVRLADGTELVASGDHRFLSQRGWRFVRPADQRDEPRRHMEPGTALVGLGASVMRAIEAGDEERAIAGQALKQRADLSVVSIEPLGFDRLMYDITTGTEDFIANGVVSHNCYARPSHQYLGFGAGTDFDRKIVVKTNAPEVLRATLMKSSWKGETIVFSGNTDCYQGLEANYELTRRCLQVCAEFRNPIGIITKGALVRRDRDVLADLAKNARAHVFVSIPFADDEMARRIEPFASAPTQRFETVRLLADAGIPVGIALAPVIPGLNEHAIPEILKRGYEAGARRAFMSMLRLPREVLPVFDERLQEALPETAHVKVRNMIRGVRGGRDNESEFFARGRGKGPVWDTIRALFHTQCKRLGYETGEHDAPAPTTFRRPTRQGSLF